MLGLKINRENGIGWKAISAMGKNITSWIECAI
jgi:hypothetical protein